MKEYEVIILAVIVSIATQLIKLPIKAGAREYSRKHGKDKNMITRFITFIPLILGITVASIYTAIFWGVHMIFSMQNLYLGLSVSSLSLAIYAYVEKFLLKNIASKTETVESLNVIKKLATSTKNDNLTNKIKIYEDGIEENRLQLQDIISCETTAKLVQNNVVKPESQAKNKIILGGKGNEEL